MNRTSKTKGLAPTSTLAKSVRRSLATAAFASILFGAGAFSHGDDWDYTQPISAGNLKYNNIVEFGSNTELQIAVSGGQNVTFGTPGAHSGSIAAIPFYIYSSDGIVNPDAVDRSTLNVKLTGNGTIRFGSNGGSNVVGGNDGWEITGNHSLTTDENIHFICGGDGGTGANGGAGHLKLNNSGIEPILTRLGGTLTLGGNGGDKGCGTGGSGGAGLLELLGDSALQTKGTLTLGGNGGNGKLSTGSGGNGTLKLNNSGNNPIQTILNGDLFLGGNGGLSTESLGGLGGEGRLEISGGSNLLLKGTVLIGGNGGNDRNGGNGTLTMTHAAAYATFENDVTLGGRGGIGGNDALGTVTISNGTLAMTGDNTMTLRGATSNFTMTGGSFKSSIDSVTGIGVTVAANTFDLKDSATLAFDMTDAVAGATPYLTLNGTNFSNNIGSQYFDILLADGKMLDQGTYTLIHTNATIVSTGTIKINGHDDVRIMTALDLQKNGQNLDLTVGTLQNTTVTWTGRESSIWNSLGGKNWTGFVNGKAVTQFYTGDSILFDNSTTNKTVNVHSALEVDTMTVTGRNYSFNVNLDRGGSISANLFTNTENATIIVTKK